MYKKTFPTLVILVITFFLAIGYSVNNTYAQEVVSDSYSKLEGADYYDTAQTNILYNFNELFPNSLWYNQGKRITFLNKCFSTEALYNLCLVMIFQKLLVFCNNYDNFCIAKSL
jgi:hypothetical protein